MKQNEKPTNIHEAHRSRMKETFLKSGLSSFSEIEKLEFLLYFSIPYKDTNPIAHALLSEFKTINNIINAPVEALTKIEGVGEHTAIFLKTLHDFINEYTEHKNNDLVIDKTSKAKEFCKNLYGAKTKESFYVICLNTAGNVINYKCIGKGGLAEVSVELKDIALFAYNNNSERIILSHNHPSGSTDPSDEDIAFTERILLGLVINDIEVLDHIIVGTDNVYSMCESKMLEDIKRHAFASTKLNFTKLKQTKAKYEIG